VPTYSNAGAGANIKGARALILGAQAAVVAHGKDTDDQGKMKVVERTFDYGKRYGVGVTLIWGSRRRGSPTSRISASSRSIPRLRRTDNRGPGV
jgi:hypothetical protein